MTKSTKWHERPAKTQSDQSSLSAWGKLGFLATHWAHSEDSDQTGRMLGTRSFCCFALWQLIWCKCSSESPRLGDSNEYPQRMFLRRNNENYLLIIIKYPPYLFFWLHDEFYTCVNNIKQVAQDGNNRSPEVGWLCWGLTSQSTIFQSCRDGAIASWVINQYFRGVKCLAQGHNTAAVGLEPRTSRSGVRHSTTEPPRSPSPEEQLAQCINIIRNSKRPLVELLKLLELELKPKPVSA